MIENFTVGAIYGFFLALSFGLLGNALHVAFLLIKGNKSDE